MSAKKQSEEKDPENNVATFITKIGKKVVVRGLSPFMVQKIDASVEKEWLKTHETLPSPPVYKTEIDGKAREFPHDESTLDDSQFSEEEKKQNHLLWDAYLKELEEYRRIQSDRMVNVFFLRGVEIDPEILEDDTWIVEQKFLGVEVPEDLTERKIHYIQTEMLGSFGDLTGLLAEIMKLSEMTKEDVDAAMASFQVDME